MKKIRPRIKVYFCRHYLRPLLRYNKLWWKDKFSTPCCDKEPTLDVHFLGLCLYMVWGDDQYWEQWLWLNKYCHGDYEQAKSSWTWRDFYTQKSTWSDRWKK